MRYLYIPLFCIACLACGCTKKAMVASGVSPEAPGQIRIAGNPLTALPKATAFKMSGDYADKVAVTLNSDGSILYYPAPSDITSDSAPYALGEGWYLNRQGLTANSVFTRWTFDEYKSLSKAPSRQEIKDAIIPGARVTELMQLPVSISEALSDPAACIKYIK